MDSLEYSIEAEEAKGLFYNKEFTVYVEGDDDVLFWDILFKLASKNVYIEEVGGFPEIEKKIDDILNKKASFIVACDSDHSDFTTKKTEHAQIIRTYGYSIENSMYNKENIEDAIIKLSKKPSNLNEIIDDWIDKFSKELFDLLVFDIANHRYKKGVQVFGDNCQRFLKNRNSIELCDIKITAYINTLKDKFTAPEIEKSTTLLKNSEKDLWFHLKGHFLTYGVYNLIRHHVKEISGSSCSISGDNLYALTVDCSKTWNDKTDIKFLVDKINDLNIN